MEDVLIDDSSAAIDPQLIQIPNTKRRFLLSQPGLESGDGHERCRGCSLQWVVQTG